jgi:hypothetical protein
MLRPIALLARSRGPILGLLLAASAAVYSVSVACTSPRVELLTTSPDAGVGGQPGAATGVSGTGGVSASSEAAVTVSTVGGSSAAGGSSATAVTTTANTAVTGGGGAPPEPDCADHDDCDPGSLCRDGQCELCSDSMSACAEPFDCRTVNGCLICECPADPD